MAHNVTERDGVFTVRKPAWWDVDGTHVLEDYPTRQQAQQIAHPWEPVSEPLYRKVLNVSEDGTLLTEEYVEVEGWVGAARSDDGHFLGVNSDTYELVHNAVMYDIAEAIEGEAKGSVKFETGGSLKGGSKVWLLIRLRDPLVIAGHENTETIPYYALQNAHDSTGAFRGQATMTRIVCDNTAQMADLDAELRGTEFVFSHTKNVRDRIEEAKTALAGWRTSVQAYRLMSEHLLDVKIDITQRREFIEQFIPMPPPHVVSDRVVANVKAARGQLYGILESPTCVGIEDTAYGLVQASVEYLNHYRKARSAETRFKRAYLDRDRIVTDAVALAQEVAR